MICVIVSLRQASNQRKRLFDGEHVRDVKNISPYLIEGDNTIVAKRSRPLSAVPPMMKGNQPTDGGNLIMLPSERDAFLGSYPEAARFVRRFYGSQEFIKGIERWCLWIEDSELAEALAIPEIARRIEAVHQMRLESPAPSTVAKASTSYRFIQIQDYGKDAIIIPSVSSETRRYLPVGLVGSNDIISNLAFGIYDAPVYLMAILSSRLHLVWTAAISGRMKSDYRYSNTLVWHTFPIPELSDSQKQMLEEAAWAILAERELHSGKTLADLYDPEAMPPGIVAAHQEVDAVLESIYAGHSFANDIERLEHLFKRYKLLVARGETPLLTSRPRGRRRANA